jgi:hypothetical protein
MKRILIAFTIVLLITFIIRAQPRDRDCDLIGIPAACDEQSRAVQALEDRIAHLQQQLNNSPAAKPQLLRTITGLNADLDTAKANLRRCIRQESPPEAAMQPGTIAMRVAGTASLETTNSKARGPFIVDLDIGVRFSRNRCEIVVTRFPTITTKTDEIALLGRRVTIEVTQNSAGTGVFHPISRRMSITMNLHFLYKTGYADPDDVTFHLSTEGSVTRRDGTVETGSALDDEGNIKLVGSGKFVHGFLAESAGRLVISARLSGRP